MQEPDRTTDLFEAHLESVEDAAEILATFERVMAERGVSLTSEAFYTRYLAGKFDDPVGLAWATYYEAHLELLERSRRKGELVVPPALVAC